MAIDPFADLGPENDTEETTTNPSTKKETTTVTTQDSQAKIVTTLKGGSGYEAPWIVIHSDTADEALEVLQDEKLKELIDHTKKVASYFNGGSAKKSNGKPAGATQAPNGQEPPEGYVFKSGVGKTGKVWKAFMPIDRNSGKEVIWL